jgi:hypothetical protein
MSQYPPTYPEVAAAAAHQRYHGIRGLTTGGGVVGIIGINVPFTLLGSRFSVRVQFRSSVPGSQVHASRFGPAEAGPYVPRLLVEAGVAGPNTEPRTPNQELNPEPEHEPRSEKGEA